MSTAQETTNKATFRHLTEAMNTGDRDLMSKAIDAAFPPDALIHTPMPVQATGSQAIKEVFGALYRAFPDLHIAVDDLIEEGDKMVARNTVTGTHRGEYMGVPPTGKLIKYNEIFVLRFVNGRIAEQGGRRRPLTDETARRDPTKARSTRSESNGEYPGSIAERCRVERSLS
jgi:predicted ester cyclase